MSSGDVLSSIFPSFVYNYRSALIYIQLFNEFLAKFPESNSSFEYCYKLYDLNARLISYGIYKIESIQNSTFSKENEIQFIIMHDQIDKFKDYIIQNSLENIEVDIIQFENLSAIEASAYFGSINIFNFLYSSLGQIITVTCFHYSFIGGNTDIINECLKFHPIDKLCMFYIISSHNNKFLEYVFKMNLYDMNLIEDNTIISSKNMKAMILMLKKDKNSIVPWFVAFPRSTEILMNEKLDVSKFSTDFSSILHYSTKYANEDVCKLLLSSSGPYKLDPNLRNEKGQTPLHYAIQFDHFEIAHLLILHGANVNSEDICGDTPLHLAAKLSLQMMAGLLISHGANLNAKNKKGKTPLHYCARVGNINTAELLISHGVDINVKYYKNKTALHTSSKHDQFKIAQLLVEHGIELNALDIHKENALHYAIYSGTSIDELLITSGINIMAANEEGQTPLHFELIFDGGSLELILDRLKSEDINVKDKIGKTSLHYSIDNGNKLYTSLLISKGADVNAQDNKGLTCLHNAAQGNQIDDIEMLLSVGADINAKAIYGETCLDIAMKQNFNELAELLISRGVNSSTYE